MANINLFHTAKDANAVEHEVAMVSKKETVFAYTFKNFFHPFVGALIEKLNKESLSGLLDPEYHDALRQNGLPSDTKAPNSFFKLFKDFYQKPDAADLVEVEGFPKEIDVSEGGPYANYNWELLFHIPLMIAVHMSKNQRFAEAQRWFHFIFDPTSNDTSVPAPKRFWRFLAFRNGDVTQIDELLALLSTPDDELNESAKELKEEVFQEYQNILIKPFQPHAVARVRHVAYQYSVVMKYLDNLIAWGDHLFRQDTMESINEATQLYVLAANILGARPQRIPPAGTIQPKTFAQLKAKGLDPIGNAWVELEGEFPFGLSPTQGVDPDAAGPLFGIGRTLYFCIPRNEKLLGYWDTVADRLFKIRHCMNIEGIVRQLALFDPPLDPSMLVKAAAAGIDIGSIVSGLNQPMGPVRSLFLIQKALELASEVRSLGNALLSAIEKGDSEHMALLRQGHEIKIQQLSQEVRFLQWKQAQESTESLLRSRASALERYRYYLRLLGQTPDSSAAPDALPLDRLELTEENFDEAYSALVGQYEKTVPVSAYPQLKLAGDTSPASQSGASGQGTLYLNINEHADLNEHAESALEFRNMAAVTEAIVAVLALIPDFHLKAAYWGVGSDARVGGGTPLSAVQKAFTTGFDIKARSEEKQGQEASKTGSYERRADDWRFQANSAARELMQIGRQIIGSLIAEQIAYREYVNVQKQIEQSQEVDRFLREKFTNEELYAWMQGELSRLYYEYYRFAFDTARKAEQTMKHELMRPEVDATEYVKFNYWDGGRKGLLSGEALYLDIKRMEMAYHENNKREYELTKHVSLRQLDPVALLTLKASGTCEITLPEWLFDLDGPGHYMRRLKNVSLSIPSVTGPYTSVNCTLSLLKSSLRKSPLLKDGEYARQGNEDDRFVDYFGTIQSIVTSSGNNDSGVFETNLRDERFLPFEGHGVVSTWKLELPSDLRQFDYNTISDVILHLRYVARQGGAQVRQAAVAHIQALLEEASTSGLAQLFSLRHDFPSAWHRFVTGDENFKATVKKEFFPYFIQSKKIDVNKAELYAIQGDDLVSTTPGGLNLASLSDNLDNEGEFELTLTEDAVLERDKDARVFLAFRYTIS